MDDKRRTKISKFVSLVLRHRPERIGLTLGEAGWADIEDLLAKSAASAMRFSRQELDEVVTRCPKQRFAVSEDGRRIRANQGHSIEVELGYAATAPPEILFHGTYPGAVDPIREGGLKKMSRRHVHLSADAATAETVGRRRGRPVVLTVDAARMAADGHEFFRAENGVWLTDRVPPEYLSFPTD